MTKVRGGRQAYDQLLADLQIVYAALRDITNHSTSVRLVEGAAEDGTVAVRAAIDLVKEVLGPMLERRDRTFAADIDALTQRMSALETRVTQLDLERRGIVPFRDGKQERG